MSLLPPGRLATTAWSILALAFVGCGTVKQTGTARTGTEQLLLTSSFDRALQKVDFRNLTGVPVYLDTTNITTVDQGWVVSSLRQALLTQGVLLKPKAEQAQFIVEARVGAYGTDDYSLMIGVPQITVPPTLTGIPSGTSPEMPLVKKSDQQAVTKLALFAYHRTSGQIVWTSGTQIEKSNAKNMFVGGFGPIQSGTIRGGTEIVGIKVPIGEEDQPDAKEKGGFFRRRKKQATTPVKPDDTAPIGSSPAPMAAKSDLDGFRP
jgi:hypothetical protein